MIQLKLNYVVSPLENSFVITFSAINGGIEAKTKYCIVTEFEVKIYQRLLQP